MPVSFAVREAECAIDSEIRTLPIWHQPRKALLRSLLEAYRDEIERIFILARSQLSDARILERDLHAGVLQTLKWAMEYTKLQGRSKYRRKPPTPNLLDLMLEIGRPYEILVDALKMAKHDEAVIEADLEHHVLTIYEGGNLTGEDESIIAVQHSTGPTYRHVPLTEDCDQLTSKWTAAEFRSTATWLREVAEAAEPRHTLEVGGVQVPLPPRPVIVSIPPVSGEVCRAVLDDLTLTAEIISQGKWQLTSWLDMPLVLVGSRVLGVSNVLKAVGGGALEDHMLRIASRSDQEQYSKVSGLREQRMIKACLPVLEKYGWSPTPRFVHPGPPKRELDIYATKGQTHLVLQLKSTIRPETPWESYKRNEDILGGISHTAEVLQRFPDPKFGFLLTDGYRGDYKTWALALEEKVMTGVITDMELVAHNPADAMVRLRKKHGIHGGGRVANVPDREIRLLGWVIRMIDRPAPE